LKRLLPFVVVLLLILLVVCAPFLIPVDRYKVTLAERIGHSLNHKVVIGGMDIGVFPPSVRLKDFSLLDVRGENPLLHADQVIAVLNLPALLRAAVVPQVLNFKGWQAAVNRNADGSWAWDEWFGSAAHLGEQHGWPIRLVTFDRGELHAVDRFGPNPAEFVIQVLQGAWERDRKYMSINGVFTSLPTPVSFLFQGSGQFVTATQWTGVLGLTDESRQWKLECSVAPAGVSVNGNSAQWRFDTAYSFLRFYARLPVPAPIASPNAFLTDWKSSFEEHASTLTFVQSAGVSGGHAEVTGVLLFPPGPGVAKIDIALQNAKLQPIEAVLFGNSSLDGLGTGLAHFELPLASAAWANVSGQGAIDIKDGRYYWPEASARSLAKAKTMRYFQKKYPGFMTSGLGFSRARTRWQIRRGIFNFEDAFVNLGDAQVALAGRYDAARQGLDAFIRVQIQERNADLLKELPPSYVYRGAGVPQIQPMNGQIVGTPSEWRVRAVRASKIPPAVINSLSKTIRNK
jgi:hypothetical protein